MIWHRWHSRRQFIGDFLFRTEALKRNNGFYKLPFAWGSDDITTSILAKEKGIVNTDTPVFKYRVNEQTISKTGDVKVRTEAILQEKKWVAKFLENNQPKNQTDAIYLRMLQERIDKHFAKKKIEMISRDINVSYLRFFYWTTKRRNYELTFPMVVYALLEAIKSRFS